MERRELFSSFFKKDEEPKRINIRPPYFIDESAFLKECISCEGLCSTACEEGIILIEDDKTPNIDFNIGGCTYCDDCATACPTDVLLVENKRNINLKIEIDMLKCVSWHDTMCFSCKDPCDDDAIEFLGMFRPSIIDDCTSCGFCIGYCPTQAIVYKEINN